MADDAQRKLAAIADGRRCTGRDPSRRGRRDRPGVRSATSGTVVVGRIGDDLRMDYTAQGHTVGLAQRMEALAEPATCYLTGATANLVSGYFDLDDLGEFQVKGVAEPVQVFELRGIGSARTMNAAATCGPHSPASKQSRRRIACCASAPCSPRGAEERPMKCPKCATAVQPSLSI